MRKREKFGSITERDSEPTAFSNSPIYDADGPDRLIWGSMEAPSVLSGVRTGRVASPPPAEQGSRPGAATCVRASRESANGTRKCGSL